MTEKIVYLDNNSTTRPKTEVIDAMIPYLTDKFYNPSSIYSQGAEVAGDIEDARRFFADSIGAKSDEIYFVSCGSEANNWVFSGVAQTYKPVYFITDNIEHHSILNSVTNVKRKTPGFVKIIPVGKDGIVKPSDVEAAFKMIPREDCIIVVSVMTINNEIGTIQPISRIAEITHAYGGYFHTDAVQAYGKKYIDVIESDIDMMSVSSHKLGAPRGSGFLYVNQNIPFRPLIYGGQQERNMRAGTENTACIIGFRKAAELALKNIHQNYAKLTELRNHLIGLLDIIKQSVIINRGMKTFPNTVSVDFGVPAEAMMVYLNEFGICVSSGSACNSKDDKPSHVLKAIGLTDEQAGRVIRFSLSPENTIEELEYTAKVIERGIEVLPHN